MPHEVMVISLAGIGLVVVLAVGEVVKTWIKRRPGVGPGELAILAGRLERIEQAIDTMAVEVERIAEGQRFTTKLLAERAATPQGAPHP